MDTAVRWIGHAACAVESKGKIALIDPLGRKRCSPYSKPSVVLITHTHVDHLNRWTLQTIHKDTCLVVPKGALPIVQSLGFRQVIEMYAWEDCHVGPFHIVAVPTKHTGGRWRSRLSPGCLGYVVHTDGKTVYHSGDIDMSTYDVFDKIGKEFSIDVTLLPIGGMLPVWYYRARRNCLDCGVHIDPDTALTIAKRIGATTFVPVHWGTLHIPLPMAGPKKRLEK